MFSHTHRVINLPASFPGNSITILALVRCPKLISQATTVFVLSLCISDLIFCSISLPLTAARYIYEEWILGTTCCKLFPVLFYGNVALSLLNMVAITINRLVFFFFNFNSGNFLSGYKTCVYRHNEWSAFSASCKRVRLFLLR